MMDPKKDPRRRCLKVEEWPATDRVAWQNALQPGDILEDDRGLAAHWAPDTVHKNRRGYGRWINWLAVTGRLDSAVQPAARVTREAVKGYLEELRVSVSPYTVRNRVAELLAVIRAIAPSQDWSWLKLLLTRLDAEVRIGREKAPRIRSSAELSAWGLRAMKNADSQPSLSAINKAIRYRDGLMIALLSTCPTLRRGNFASITIGRHLRSRSEGYDLIFEAHETKTRRPLEIPVAAELTEPLDSYLTHHRPVLLRGSSSDRLWIARNGRPMSAMSVYHRIVKVTTRAFGTPLNPHLFRDCAATTIAVEDPAHVRIAAPVLGHSSFATTEKYYIQANSLEASRRLRETLLALRRYLNLPSARSRRRKRCEPSSPSGYQRRRKCQMREIS